ncbi:MAG: antitoxin VapB family protein [Methanothrix sp.]|uniref:antitoxin VapB family protein n=1 Tax=Methanothrix sp. TaxID=90426 RepID=UPI0025FF2F7E|nr:antitoxin VapB family protein [Methanothrix sp.]MCK9405433.1 antitoxin VapB family protein [Methanothrix sp.]
MKKQFIQVRTLTLMSTKTITITEEAYERLKSRKGKNQSFSEVIIHNLPAKRKLSEIMDEIGRDDDLADLVETASIEMRHSRMRDASDAGA